MKNTKNLKNRVMEITAIILFALVISAMFWSKIGSKRTEAEFANPETIHVSGPVSYGTPTSGVTAQVQDALIQSRQREITMSPVETELVQSSVDSKALYTEMDEIEEEIVEMNTPKPEPITYNSANIDYMTNPDVLTDKHYEVIESNGMNKKMYISDWLVNVRQKPGTDFEVVTTLAAGTEVTVECLAYDVDGNKWAQIGEDKFIRMDLLTEDSPLMYMGEYLITYYCACAKCCDVETGITASGAHVQEGVTCAADKSIPFGTKLKIGDHVYTVQDRGGAIKGKHIDIYIDGHQRALNQDMGYKDVYMVMP